MLDQSQRAALINTCFSCELRGRALLIFFSIFFLSACAIVWIEKLTDVLGVFISRNDFKDIY